MSSIATHENPAIRALRDHEEKLARRRERRRARREAETPEQRARRLAERRARRSTAQHLETLPTAPSLATLREGYEARRRAWLAERVAIRTPAREALATLHLPALRPVVREPPTQSLPDFVVKEMKEMATALGRKWDCPVCMDEHSPKDMVVRCCGHKVCEECDTRCKETRNYACPICRA